MHLDETITAEELKVVEFDIKDQEKRNSLIEWLVDLFEKHLTLASCSILVYFIVENKWISRSMSSLMKDII
jgi:hypothetical protein